MSYQLTATEYSSKTDPSLTPVRVSSRRPDCGRTIRRPDLRLQRHADAVPAILLFRRVHLQPSRLTVTANNGDPSVVPYSGDIYTVITTASLRVESENRPAGHLQFFPRRLRAKQSPHGVPLGIDFTRHELFVGLTRQLTQNLSGALHYEFSQYSEPSSGNLNNFTAHGVFATLVYRWP